MTVITVTDTSGNILKYPTVKRILASLDRLVNFSYESKWDDYSIVSSYDACCSLYREIEEDQRDIYTLSFGPMWLRRPNAEHLHIDEQHILIKDYDKENRVTMSAEAKDRELLAELFVLHARKGLQFEQDYFANEQRELDEQRNAARLLDERIKQLEAQEHELCQLLLDATRTTPKLELDKLTLGEKPLPITESLESRKLTETDLSDKMTRSLASLDLNALSFSLGRSTQESPEPKPLKIDLDSLACLSGLPSTQAAKSSSLNVQTDLLVISLSKS